MNVPHLKSVYMTLRDMPEGVDSPVQTSYLNMIIGMFLRTFIKIYAPGEFSEEDRAKLRKYLERIFEAKDATIGKSKEGREY
ncbi:MAG TPA: hypothetical protein VHD69_01110 [Candidatus Paceibacterota bacterium]|jgi:hypothetical protein|nr:hypothetical protein [Candidatus Paceibacterota bacterium]